MRRWSHNYMAGFMWCIRLFLSRMQQNPLCCVRNRTKTRTCTVVNPIPAICTYPTNLYNVHLPLVYAIRWRRRRRRWLRRRRLVDWSPTVFCIENKMKNGSVKGNAGFIITRWPSQTEFYWATRSPHILIVGDEQSTVGSTSKIVGWRIGGGWVAVVASRYRCSYYGIGSYR